MAEERVKTMKEKAVLERAKMLKNPTDRLGPSSLMTQQSHVNASRMIMVAQHIGHHCAIRNPEAPLVPTGFENVLASFSSMLDKTDGEYEIVAKFEKNDYNYVLIGFDKKHRRYHAWKRVELEEHSEEFCTRFNNTYMDNLEIGDVVPAETYITKSDPFDKHMNYRMGKNLNTLYMVSAKVLEDGILVMNGADSMMNTFRSNTITINLSDNEILLNWYGDKDNYQPLPKIGEKAKNGVVAAVRRIDNSKAPYALKTKRLMTHERGDRRYFGKGRVIDYDILYNYKDKDRMAEIGATKQLKKMFEEQQTYYKTLYKYMIGIVDKAYEGEYTYSDEFTMICEEAHDYIDASAFFADSNDNLFGNIQIVIHLMDEEKLSVGSKLVGRYGNKGVISKILPPEKSWKMEDGTPVHVVVAALGIVGRLNQAQMNEHAINGLSSTAIEMMKLTDKPDEKLRIVYNLMKYLNSDEADSFKKWYKKLDNSDKAKLCRRIERDGITIVQDPIDNANLFEIGEAYQDFPPKWQHIVFPNGGKSMRRMICAKMFYMRLKQDPMDKYSVRSRGPVNPLNTLPAKSSLKKKSLSPFSDVPVRVGEYEIEVLLGMVNHPALIANFMRECSTSWPAKMILAEQTYMGDPDEEVEIGEIEVSSKKNYEQLCALTGVLGMNLDIEYEDAEPGEYFLD